MISVEDVVNYSEMILSEVDSHKLDVTFFEIVTMIAFLHYREQKIDVAVLECGMGGRLDATNICESKTAVITSIGLDHCEILGATTDEICIEKCGIIRHGVTDVIIGPTVNSNLVKIKSNKIGAALSIVEKLSDYKQTNTEIAKQVVCKYLDVDPKSVSDDLFRGE
jgi:dihydrofolate synthase/folylpolyglutamate synthase